MTVATGTRPGDRSPGGFEDRDARAGRADLLLEFVLGDLEPAHRRSGGRRIDEGFGPVLRGEAGQVGARLPQLGVAVAPARVGDLPRAVVGDHGVVDEGLQGALLPVEGGSDQAQEERGAAAATVEDDRHPPFAHESPDPVEHGRERRGPPGVRRGSDHEEGVGGRVDPVVGGRGHRQAHASHARLRQGAGPMGDAHVTIDVPELQRRPTRGHAAARQGAPELRDAVDGGAPRQGATQRLDPGGPIEAEEPAELVWRVLRETLRPLDAQQRHEQQRHHRRTPAVERGAEAAVDLAGDHEDVARDHGGQRERGAGTRQAVARSKPRRGVVEEAGIRQETVQPPVGRIGVERHRRVLRRGGGPDPCGGRTGRGDV